MFVPRTLPEPGAAYGDPVFKYVTNKTMNDHCKLIGFACSLSLIYSKTVS